MTMQDPISDLLTRMRNAQMAATYRRNSELKAKQAILQVLLDEGYITAFGFR